MATDVLPETFREWRPPLGLAAHVVCFWIRRVPAGAPPYVQRTVPNGSAELVYALGSPPRVVGPETKPTETVVPPGTTAVGVRLRPEAGSALLGPLVGDLVDMSLDADVIRRVDDLEPVDPMPDEGSDAVLICRLRSFLGAWVRRARPLDPLAIEAVRRISGDAAPTLTALAASLYVSERQLRRRVEAATGLSPKTLHRHLRYQRFLALATELPHTTGGLAGLAMRAGYADQAHLTRESVQLQGRPPLSVVTDSQHHCRRAHDHAASYQPLLPGPSFRL